MHRNGEAFPNHSTNFVSVLKNLILKDIYIMFFYHAIIFQFKTVAFYIP